MITLQRTSFAFGLGFTLAGVAGFVFTGASMHAGMDAAMLFGLFPVNAVHNGVHLLLGLWGLAAARGARGARHYCQISGIAYLLLAALALVSPSVFGIMPIGGNDVWLHTVMGLGLAFAGFVMTEAPRLASE